LSTLRFNGFLSSHTITGQTLTIRSGIEHTGTISGATVGNNVNLPVTVTVTPNGGAAISLNGAISGSGGLTKNGAGTLTLNGNNSYSGTTTLNGGTLLFGSGNTINDSSGLNLAGGILNLQGNSETAGNLTISGNSTIDLGSGNVVLDFDSATYTSGQVTISNWNGSTSGGGDDQILFSSAPSQQFLDSVIWSDQNVTGAFYKGGEIVPVPEPSTIIGGCVLGVIALIQLYRKRESLFTRQSAR
jgi:autotransporter-associated beta strand protein